MAQYARTPVHKTLDFDGNGKLSPSEKAVGVKLIENPKGPGWLRVDPRKKVRLATIQDASDTKQLNKLENLDKENKELKDTVKSLNKTVSDYSSLIKDMDARLRKMEDGK